MKMSTMRRFSCSTVLAECGEISTFGRSHKGLVLGQGLDRRHVERGAGEAARSQRRDQGRLVDHGAARDVDQQGALPQGGELGGADQAVGLGRERAGQDQGVDLAERRREIGHGQDAADALGRRRGRAPRTPDLEVQCGKTFRDRPADGAEPDHQRAAAGELAVGVALPAVRALHALQPRHVAIEVEQGEDDELGERGAMHARPRS